LDEVDLNVPIVLYHRSSEKHCFVNVDSYHTGQEVARLFASRGHSRVGLIAPEISSSAIRLRKEGFLHAAKPLGIEVKEEFIVGGDFSEEGGYIASKMLLQSRELPTALFAASDQMAIGALKALRESGIRVPQDIEIIGHGDYENSRFSEPALTTVHLPIEQMASTCVHMLVALMGGHNRDTPTPFSKIFNTNFVIRDTCGDFIKN
jgi:DNA-binding LacI/PurR family transcriptional regulator